MADAIKWCRGEYFNARRRRNYEMELRQVTRVTGDPIRFTDPTKFLGGAAHALLVQNKYVPESAILLAVALPIVRHTLILCYMDNSFPEVPEASECETVRVDLDVPAVDGR